MEKKLIKTRNGWVLVLNSDILKLLKIDPFINMVNYSIMPDKLIITKSDKTIT